MRAERVARAAFAVAVGLGVVSATADAQRTASGLGRNGMTWEATSRIVGVTSTATAAGGGDLRYFAAQPANSGVVALIMDYGPDAAGVAQRFICSGTLLADRVSILTAAHCVSSGFGTANPISTTVFFPGSDPDAVVSAADGSGSVAQRSVVRYAINPGYTGEVIDQNDIAVLRMGEPAPASARSYGIFSGSSLTSTDFNVAGYGARSNAGGSVGANLGTGRLRQGDNRFDFRFGDSDFAGFWTDRDPAGENFFGLAEISSSYISDFDNGLAAQDASCRIANAIGPLCTSGDTKYNNRGRGASEVSVAGGDSGGPQFVNGMIASFTSYGLSFGMNFGDIDVRLNSSFGEFNGFVPVYIHAGFIAANVVPEPATFALMGAGLFALGVIARRRRVS